MILSSANIASLYVRNTFFVDMLPSNSRARFLVLIRYSDMCLVAAMCSRNEFCRNSESFEYTLAISGLVMTIGKFKLPTCC
jgi:hypothetical protein